MNYSKRNKKPWPTDRAMTQIYEKHLWGGATHDYFSGEGSHDTKIVAPYLAAVQRFLTSFKQPLSVCDLGCGDFNIGKELVAYTKTYTGVDIVAPLIQRNIEKYSALNVCFLQQDIATDKLPKADCVIIRQVLQHLCNNEISNILHNIKEYKYAIITEHLPKHNEFTPNVDILSGQGIRLKKQSGVVVTAAPFYLKTIKTEELLTTNLDEGKGRIVTTLYYL